MYHWTVTKNLLDAKPCKVVGPRSATMTSEEIASHPDRKRFRMLDDDDEVYFEGFLVGGEGFEPLDDYGTPGHGCTSIEFATKHGGWERL